MAERAPLEAVLLDAGGTLVRLDFEWMAGEVTGLGAPLDPATLRRGEIEGRRRYDASRATGDPSARPYFAGMLVGAGIPEALIDPAIDRFRLRHEAQGLWTRPMEGARAAVAALGALGLRCAVISNSDGRAELHLRDCDVLAGLEFVVDSHLVGIEKPDAAIFRIALERLGVDAATSLFVGDIRSVDEQGARAAGLHFVLLDPHGDYAAPEGDAIVEIGRLADWIAERFELPARRPVSAIEPSPGANRAHTENRT